MKTTRALLFIPILAGCAVGPDYHPPKTTVESSFAELGNTNAGISSHTTTNSPALDWWRAFNDPELERLMNEALHENYNLRIAVARVRQARYQRSIVAADLFPNIDADGGYFHALGSKNVALSLGGSQSSGGSAAGGKSPATSPHNKDAKTSDPPGGTSSSVGPSPFSSTLTPFGEGGLPGVASSVYQIGFDSTWELDVFGGNRRRLEAAADDLGASIENLHDVTISLMAEVAIDYFELRGSQRELAVARENLATQRETLELTISRAKSGLNSQADVTRAAAEADSTAATIPPLEASARRSIHALSTLLAKEPAALSAELENEKPLPALPPEVPVGLPSELLERRPDIRQAERQLAGATARVGGAEADLFPKFGLTGGIGLDSTSTGNLFDWQSHYFLISPTVIWRVFDAGRIVSNIALQKANRQESLWQYRNTLLTALREVEDGLVAYGTEQERRAALENALKESQDSFNLIRDRYEHGLEDFLAVLDAQRTVLSTENELTQSDQAVATDLVSLYKALGGGWEVHK